MNNIIPPIGDLSFRTVKDFFGLEDSKDVFWREMLNDFQGIYSTIDWETDKYDTVSKSFPKDEDGNVNISINYSEIKSGIIQENLLEDFEKQALIKDLSLIQNAKLIKKLRALKLPKYVENPDAIIKDILGFVPEDNLYRKFLPYKVKEYKQSNNKSREPFKIGSIISSRSGNNKFELINAFKLLLFLKTKIFKSFIYKKLNIKTENTEKYDYLVIFNYGEVLNFNEGLYLDCIKSICSFIKQTLPHDDGSINNIMLVGQSMGGNMAIHILINLVREFNYPLTKLYAICSAFPSGLREDNAHYFNKNFNGHYVSFMAMGETDITNTSANTSSNSNKLTSKNIVNGKISLNSFYYKGSDTPINTLVFLYRKIDKGFKLSNNLYSIDTINASVKGNDLIGNNAFHNLQLIFKGIKKILNHEETFEIQNAGKRYNKSIKLTRVNKHYKNNKKSRKN